MDMQELEQIEHEESVELRLNDAGRIVAKGAASAVDRVFARIRPMRDEVAVALRERQGEAVVEREIAVAIPSLAKRRLEYEAWANSKSSYFIPTREEGDRMWAQLREGDIVHFDFAHSITVERDGQFFAVDRKGRIAEPSLYSPAVACKG